MNTDNRTPGRAAREASTLGLGVLLVAVLLVLVNYFGWKYHQRMDWTASEIYSLSEKTENIVRALDRDVDVVVFMEPTDELYKAVMELLARYDAVSPRLTVREVDPSRNLAEAQELVDRYQIESVNVVLFESEGDRRLVEVTDLAEYDYSGMQFGQGPQMTGFAGEQQFTSTLLELTSSERPKVVFTSGHGELQLTDFSTAGLSGARELLERDNFEVETWESFGQAAVPAGTQLVVIAGPTGSFLEPELAAIRSFLTAGGRLLVLLDPTLSAAGGLVDTGLGALLDGYGVEIGEDIVVDPANPLPFMSADTIFVDSYGAHPITRSLSQAALPTVLSLARSLRLAADIEGYETSELLKTSAEGWGERDLDDLSAVQLGENDVAGPVTLGVALEASEQSDVEEPGSVDDGDPGQAAPSTANDAAPGERLVVIGDATFATNGQLQSAGNLTLLANMLNWLAEREALVAIAPKTPESVRLSLAPGEIRGIFWFVVLGLPLLVVACGVWVHQRRKR